MLKIFAKLQQLSYLNLLNIVHHYQTVSFIYVQM